MNTNNLFKLFFKVLLIFWLVVYFGIGYLMYYWTTKYNLHVDILIKAGKGEPTFLLKAWMMPIAFGVLMLKTIVIYYFATTDLPERNITQYSWWNRLPIIRDLFYFAIAFIIAYLLWISI